MSTTVGNGLTVDGTVKASQATQAGEAVVLGDDGMIPANMVASGGKMNTLSYSFWYQVTDAYTSGDIPHYANVQLSVLKNSLQSIINVKAVGSSGYVLPAEGVINDNGYYAVYAFDGTNVYCTDFTTSKLTKHAIKDDIGNIRVFWSD